MSNVRFGHQRERMVRKDLETDGWIVVRAAGSLGPIDLVAMKYGHQNRAIEVKGTKRPYSGFPPAKREEMVEIANRAGARAELAWWPKRGKLVWLASSEWP